MQGFDYKKIASNIILLAEKGFMFVLFCLKTRDDGIKI